ncbi:orotidine-5'-phosphate decarboxylase [Microvirga mediterraneensis]|uniref:Orotidine-5'-phosphate decarboxylase n=1 Tax=Microvirga mediterraneensis TaxID=2754695 RepID=A0A838BUH0_9HYPH|nr:orotidine-5'-phosphate decarboxylase [Microvirga mediterraneensis]MBA1158998.1 orotidine-5'-phosphate decarboxylase [Microvirga mediterraneensis]
MASFVERFTDLAIHRSPLCLGLDPSEELLRLWGLENDAEGLRRFCGSVLEAADDLVAVIKPQTGFFERFGPEGLNELAVATAQIRSQGSLCLIDAKRGDVAGTMKGYASAMLGAGSGFGGDAVTVSAYLGFGALLPVFDRAIALGAGVFVVVHSSNPEGRLLQDARHPDGRTVAEALADDITTFNANQGAGIGVLGAVVGATIDPAATAIIDRLPQSLILAPGVGAQGAEMAEVGPKFRSAQGRVLPSVSRAILRHGPSPVALRDAIERYREAAWSAWDAGSSLAASRGHARTAVVRR